MASAPAIFSMLTIRGLGDTAALGRWFAAAATGAVATAFALNEREEKAKAMPGLIDSVRP